MSNRNLAILSIVAAVLVIWAVLQSGISRRPGVESDEPAYLIQGLDLADVGSIVVGTGEDAVTLRRRGKGFAVANKDNYPAHTEKVNELITNCLEIKTAGFYTDNPANHQDLEVTEDKARSVVKFMTAGPNSVVLVGVALGKSTELGQGSYVRLLPTDKVYLTLQSTWIRDSAMDYIDQELITLKRPDIDSVTVSQKSEEYTLKQDEGENIVLENIEAGKKLKSDEARSVLIALTDLRCDGVTRSAGGLLFDGQYLCRLKDSTEYKISIAEKADKTFITCSAVFTEGRPTKDKTVESEEELKEKEAKLFADDKAKEFTAKHQGWIYEIADWKAKNLKKKLSDIVEDEEKPEKVEDPNAAESSSTGLNTAVSLLKSKMAEAPPKPLKPDDPNTPKPEDLTAPKAEDPNAAKQQF